MAPVPTGLPVNSQTWASTATLAVWPPSWEAEEPIHRSRNG